MVINQRENITQNTPELEEKRKQILRTLRNDPQAEVVCPNCGNKPKVIAEGKYMEHFHVWCQCGLLNCLEKRNLVVNKIIFPSGLSNSDIVDTDMQSEYEAALLAGFDIVLFDYYKWFHEGCLKLNQECEATDIIYRGWMMKPEQYEKFYWSLYKKGLRMLTDPVEYQNCHVFANSYDKVKEDTAKSLFFSCDEYNISDFKIENVLGELGPFMVKDFVKSAKNTDFPKYFDESITQDEFVQYLNRFILLRGNLFTGGICMKSYLSLKKYGSSTNEYRVYYLNGEIASVSRNANQPIYTKEPPRALIEKYRNLESPFYTVDYAEKEDGTFAVIETGDGQVSGLSPGQDMRAFYRAINILLKEKSI